MTNVYDDKIGKPLTAEQRAAFQKFDADVLQPLFADPNSGCSSSSFTGLHEEDPEDIKTALAAEIRKAMAPLAGQEIDDDFRREAKARVKSILERYLKLYGGEVEIKNVTASGDITAGRVAADISMPRWMAETLGMMEFEKGNEKT